MTILTKCHRHYLFVEGEIGIDPHSGGMHHTRQLFPSSCRMGTYFSPARKVSKSACAVARFPEGTARSSAKTFFIPSYLGQKGFFTLPNAPSLLRGQRRVPAY